MIVWRLPEEALTDPFRPPQHPCDVFCLHCCKQYSSDKMLWRHRGDEGSWCCPTPGCDGVGFNFDIFPLKEMGGRSRQDSDEFHDIGPDCELDDEPW